MKIFQFICSVLSDRLSYPWLTPGACSSSHPSSRWCHPIFSFNIVPFSSCLQSLWTAEKSQGKPHAGLWESYWPKVQQKNGKPHSELWESYWPKVKPVISNDQPHRKTLNCRSPGKTAWSCPLFKIYFFTQECCLVYLTRPQKIVGNSPFLTLGPT